MLQLHEKFSREHLKVCPMKGVYLLQLDDNMAVEEDDASLGISLHAISGISTAGTMQLPVDFSTASVHALVDSGSTHLFLSTGPVRSLTYLLFRWKAMTWSWASNG